MGTKDKPLLSKSISVLLSCVLERLTMFRTAHSRQFGFVQFLGGAVSIFH